MTPQEAYDRMRAFYSRTDTMLGRYQGACEYISGGDERARCAVGCLLPMELLEEHGNDLNRTGSIEALRSGADLGEEGCRKAFDALGIFEGGSFNVALFRFLDEAQGVHDNENAYPEKDDVIAALDELADSRGLIVGGQL